MIAGRDITWLLKNQRKEKIRDHLRESLVFINNNYKLLMIVLQFDHHYASSAFKM